MVFKKSFTLLVATGATPFFALVSKISDQHCSFYLLSAWFDQLYNCTYEDFISVPMCLIDECLKGELLQGWKNIIHDLEKIVIYILIENTALPEENPFVASLGDIAEATPTETLIDEDEE